MGRLTLTLVSSAQQLETVSSEPRRAHVTVACTSLTMRRDSQDTESRRLRKKPERRRSQRRSLDQRPRLSLPLRSIGSTSSASTSRSTTTCSRRRTLMLSRGSSRNGRRNLKADHLKTSTRISMQKSKRIQPVKRRKATPSQPVRLSRRLQFSFNRTPRARNGSDLRRSDSKLARREFRRSSSPCSRSECQLPVQCC